MTPTQNFLKHKQCLYRKHDPPTSNWKKKLRGVPQHVLLKKNSTPACLPCGTNCSGSEQLVSSQALGLSRNCLTLTGSPPRWSQTTRAVDASLDQVMFSLRMCGKTTWRVPNNEPRFCSAPARAPICCLLFPFISQDSNLSATVLKFEAVQSFERNGAYAADHNVQFKNSSLQIFDRIFSRVSEYQTSQFQYSV